MYWQSITITVKSTSYFSVDSVKQEVMRGGSGAWCAESLCSWWLRSPAHLSPCFFSLFLNLMRIYSCWHFRFWSFLFMNPLTNVMVCWCSCERLHVTVIGFWITVNSYRVTVIVFCVTVNGYYVTCYSDCLLCYSDWLLCYMLQWLVTMLQWPVSVLQLTVTVLQWLVTVTVISYCYSDQFLCYS